LCRPQTGRTHQIRLACQLLNHPIANDLNYSGDIWYGNPIGAEQSRKARAELETIHHGWTTTTTTTTEQRPCAPYRSITDEPATRMEIENMARQLQHEHESFHDFLARTCLWCARLGNSIHKKNQLEFLVRSRGYGQTLLLYFVEWIPTLCVFYALNKGCISPSHVVVESGYMRFSTTYFRVIK
jgi:hypothetical protein